jgi:hypothetical protein
MGSGSMSTLITGRLKGGTFCRMADAIRSRIDSRKKRFQEIETSQFA